MGVTRILALGLALAYQTGVQSKATSSVYQKSLDSITDLELKASLDKLFSEAIEVCKQKGPFQTIYLFAEYSLCKFNLLDESSIESPLQLSTCEYFSDAIEEVSKESKASSRCLEPYRFRMDSILSDFEKKVKRRAGE